jgi:hypothetical protein
MACSFMVGTSGSAGERLGEEAGERAAPLAAAIDDTRSCELLPSSAVIAGPPPLVGRWRSLRPAAFMNSAAGRCSAP